jgi:hypothetical protein
MKMPNIEIYGKRKLVNAVKKDEIELNYLVNKIIKAMKKIGKEDDAIIIMVEAMVIGCSHGKDLPFIRVCSTDSQEIKTIVGALKEEKIGIDIETLILDSFILAREMQ